MSRNLIAYIVNTRITNITNYNCYTGVLKASQRQKLSDFTYC